MMRERMQDLNEFDPARYSSGGGMPSGGMSPFLMGALTGAAVALLFAPQAGRDSRHWLADKARSLRKHGEEGYGEGEHEFGGSGHREERYGRSPMGEGREGTKPGMQGQGTGTPSVTPGTTPGSPKGPTTTNPVPTSPTGASRV